MTLKTRLILAAAAAASAVASAVFSPKPLSEVERAWRTPGTHYEDKDGYRIHKRFLPRREQGVGQ